LPIQMTAEVARVRSMAFLVRDLAVFLPDVEGFYRGWLGRDLP
jgi:acetone carboxylase gamma subunit